MYTLHFVIQRQFHKISKLVDLETSDPSHAHRKGTIEHVRMHGPDRQYSYSSFSGAEGFYVLARYVRARCFIFVGSSFPETTINCNCVTISAACQIEVFA